MPTLDWLLQLDARAQPALSGMEFKKGVDGLMMMHRIFRYHECPQIAAAQTVHVMMRNEPAP